MYRIDNGTALTTLPAPAAPGPTPNGFFSTGVPGTVVDGDWANAVQEEICAVIAGAGIALSKTSRNQMWQALQTIFAPWSQLGGSAGTSGWCKIPLISNSAIILQWGSAVVSGGASISVALPTSWPNGYLRGVCAYEPSFPPTSGAAGIGANGSGAITLSNSAPGSSNAIDFICVGH